MTDLRLVVNGDVVLPAVNANSDVVVFDKVSETYEALLGAGRNYCPTDPHEYVRVTAAMNAVYALRGVEEPVNVFRANLYAQVAVLAEKVLDEQDKRAVERGRGTRPKVSARVVSV